MQETEQVNVSPEEPSKPGKRRKRRPVKRPISLMFYIAFWGLIIIMFVGLIITQAGTYNELRASLDRLHENIAHEQAIAESLNVNMDFFDSDAYVERLARDLMGMVFPNEIVFRNIAD
jgi:cell division protein FtsB